jgi:hypothetical protein
MAGPKAYFKVVRTERPAPHINRRHFISFSLFEFGGHVTEIGAAGLVALRLGRDIEWDGRAMKAKEEPDAARLVQPQNRKGWAA